MSPPPAMIARFLILLLLLGLGPAELLAADLASQAPLLPTPALGLFASARLGVFAHDPGGPERGSVDVNAELLTVKPFRAANAGYDLLLPHLNLGATVSTTGRTSHAYAGFAWHVDLTQRVFLEASFGAAVHNGDTGLLARRDRSALGCPVLLRESASLGVQLDERWSLMATVEHLSNAGLCDRNRGLTNVGARLGYSF